MCDEEGLQQATLCSFLWYFPMFPSRSHLLRRNEHVNFNTNCHHNGDLPKTRLSHAPSLLQRYAIRVSNPSHNTSQSTIRRVRRYKQARHPPKQDANEALIYDGPRRERERRFVNRRNTQYRHHPIRHRGLRTRARSRNTLQGRCPSRQLQLRHPRRNAVKQSEPSSQRTRRIKVQRSSGEEGGRLIQHGRGVTRRTCERVDPVLVSNYRHVLRQGIAISDLRPMCRSQDTSNTIVPKASFSRFSHRRLLLSSLLTRHTLPFHANAPAKVPPLLSTITRLCTYRPKGNQAAKGRRRAPFMRRRIL